MVNGEDDRVHVLVDERLERRLHALGRQHVDVDDLELQRPAVDAARSVDLLDGHLRRRSSSPCGPRCRPGRSARTGRRSAAARRSPDRLPPPSSRPRRGLRALGAASEPRPPRRSSPRRCGRLGRRGLRRGRCGRARGVAALVVVVTARGCDGQHEGQQRDEPGVARDRRTRISPIWILPPHSAPSPRAAHGLPPGDGLDSRESGAIRHLTDISCRNVLFAAWLTSRPRAYSRGGRQGAPRDRAHLARGLGPVSADGARPDGARGAAHDVPVRARRDRLRRPLLREAPAAGQRRLRRDLLEHFHGSEFAASLNELGMFESGEPRRMRDVPGDKLAVRTIAEFLLPAGYREGLTMALRTEDGRVTGLLNLSTDDRDHPTDDARRGARRALLHARQRRRRHALGALPAAVRGAGRGRRRARARRHGDRAPRRRGPPPARPSSRASCASPAASRCATAARRASSGPRPTGAGTASP